MKTRLLYVLLLLTWIGAAPAWGVDEPFDVTISIRQAITITEDRLLNFGLVDALSTPQALTVDASDLGPHSAGVGAQSAQFTISGDSAYPATVTLTQPAPVSCGVGCTLTYTLVDSTGATTALNFGVTTNIWVGGSVTVPDNPTPGVYTTTGTLSIVYN